MFLFFLTFIGMKKIIMEVFLIQKIISTLLLASVAFASPAVPVKVSETYEPGKHAGVYFDGRHHYEKSYTGMERSPDQYKTIRKCLALKPNFAVQAVSRPDEIDGIKKDIPYNYTSTAESSAKLLYSAIYQDWEITKYYSEPDKITVELIKDGTTCRIIILADYLKVYQKSEL